MKSLEAFLDSDEICTLLVDGSHAILRTFDGTIVAWTKGAEDMYGWKSADALGCYSHSLLQTVFPAPLRTINAALHAKGSWVGELIHKRKDGSTLAVQSSWRVVLGHDDTEYVIEVNNDITELVQTREWLAEHESRLRLAKEIAHLGIWDWDAIEDKAVRSVEWFAQHGRDTQTTGPSYEEWLSWIHPDDRARIQETFDRAVRLGAVYEAEFRVIWPDESVHWLHTRATPVLNDSGECVRMTGVNMEITVQKEFEQRLQKMNRALEQSNEDLKQFAYAAGHDLKEPLRAVSTCTALIARRLNGTLDPDNAHLLGYIEQGAGRMQKMIDSLLEYARTADQAVALEDVRAESLVVNALTNLRAAIEESQAEITFGPLPEIYASADVLTQVFQNLIGNAIKYRKPDTPPRVRISASQVEGDWVFSVSDNGIGFPSDQKDAIFRLFARLNNSNAPGAGIGLCVCKRIVEKHGGRMWAESEPGRGSTFYFAIPISGKQAA